MDKQIYKLLNPIYNSVFGKNIDDVTYSMFAKTLHTDRSPASLARIKESFMQSKNDIENKLQAPTDRSIIYLSDQSTNDITSQDDICLQEKNILFISSWIDNQNTQNLEAFIFQEISKYFNKVRFYFNTPNMSVHDNLTTKYYPYCAGDYVNIEHFQTTMSQNMSSHFKNTCFQGSKNAFPDITFDWIVYIDPNINVPSNVDGFISSFKYSQSWDVICANRVFQNSIYYADIFDLRLDSSILDIQKIYKYFSTFYPHSYYWVDKLYSFTTFTKVISAYGGILILNKKVLKLYQLFDENCEEFYSENISLCTKFANVFVNPKLIVQHSFMAEGILYTPPSLFIPKDIDMSGALLHYLYTLTLGSRVYPYFNSLTMREKNNITEHNKFIYNTDDAENSWNSFFEPVSSI